MIDRVDEAILRLLENDGRLSFNSIGQEIGLSKTPSWARVNALERDKVITGYRAEIDPARLGLHLHAFVQVTINAAKHAEFEAAVQRHGAVLECYTTAGEADYLLHVLVPGIAELDDLLRKEISRMPGVQRETTTVAMKTIKRRGSIMDCVRTGVPPKR
ncbi:MAG TPA: Lrp/AsnC family transcriptional regulator [Steroidobacteraceae bacterium]|jgi:Lrp/AsnC family leucine-responsive transcriptional regulator|nr:Lrp/AsnC family transcriptional regulator [Steroidobacteraceae bacterium]